MSHPRKRLHRRKAEPAPAVEVRPPWWAPIAAAIALVAYSVRAFTGDGGEIGQGEGGAEGEGGGTA